MSTQICLQFLKSFKPLTLIFILTSVIIPFDSAKSKRSRMTNMQWII